MGTGSFLGVKRPRRDADHTPSSSAEVTKGYSYTSIHPVGLFRPVTGLLYLYVSGSAMLLFIEKVNDLINDFHLYLSCLRRLTLTNLKVVVNYFYNIFVRV
jgi:hypothetical protein